MINSIVFVAISYFSGVIMHEISQFVQEKVLKKIWKGMPSEKFLLKSNVDEEKQILEHVKHLLVLSNSIK